MPSGRVPIEGSEREALPGAKRVGPIPADQEVRVTIVVRRRDDAALPKLEEGAEPLSRTEFAQRFGADAADLERVAQFAREHGLEVRESDQARRTVVLAGPAAAVAKAFDVSFEEYEHEGVRFRARSGPVHVPAELAPIVTAVIGLDSRPQAKPHFRRLESEGLSPRATRAFTPLQIARLYDFPSNLDGRGQKIALIELGGGFRPNDLKTYFRELGLHAPKVTAVPVAGQPNSPSTPDSADGEVVLDIEVAGAVAPKAEILVYFARNTDRGFYEAITSAVHDQRASSIMSISWGAPEDSQFWTEQSRRVYDEAFQEAAALGMSVFVAAGDNGSTDGVGDGRQHVDFPASSPHVVGCGGTRIESANGTIRSERVWETNGATGGGVSETFPLPAWQRSAKVDKSANPPHRSGRGVPDVAGDADPASGYRVRVDGEETVIGGTSAVAPLWAGLLALVNQHRGRPAGFLNPTLYKAHTSGGFKEITSGGNGAYEAREGWNACTGLGRPEGQRLVQLLTS